MIRFRTITPKDNRRCNMKKSFILIALLMVLCFCTSSYGADAAASKSWYVGIGGSWAIENFDTDDLEDDLLNLVDVDFDDGWGGSATIGYHVNDNCSIAFVYSYLTDFEWDESIGGTGVIDIDSDLDVMTFMLEGKYSMTGDVSPYVVLGAGAMYADWDGDVTVYAAPIASGSESDTQVCGKVGLGVDWWATPEVTIGLEGSYVFGFSDHDFDGAEIGIRYFNIGLGVAYHF